MSYRRPRKTRIRQSLDALIQTEVIGHYEIQSAMPGLRWTLYGLPSYGTGRSFSTLEVEAFIEGVVAGRQALILDEKTIELA